MTVAELERTTPTRVPVKQVRSRRSRSRTDAKETPDKGSSNVDLGKRGEDAAARFLDRRGYDIVDRNWKCFAGEVDIVARDGDTLVFVEVKTRRNCDKGFPSEAVNRQKREKYEKLALAYLQDHEVTDIAVRFDVVAIVVVSTDRALIRHHINAFSVE